MAAYSLPEISLFKTYCYKDGLHESWIMMRIKKQLVSLSAA